ncbi:MAG: HAMP domain-containing protein, partial [Treponema sp.]|nr:HAMP domain-containing protein [Treponema sp.]
GSPLFDALRKSAGESVRLSYSEGGNRFVGAGHRISFADAAVFSSLEYSLVTGQITAVTRRNMLLSVTVMFLTVLVTWFFSRTVTAPLRKLMAAISQLESGEFILDLKPASTDEIGMLTGRMAEAGLALGKREEAKRLFGRYGDDGITGRAMAGELDLGARYLEAVIACADFILPPANSGNPDAAEDLNLLNFFIRKMSYCVEKTGGAAEAVTGGKIIAHWGVFPAGETGETGDRVMNAVRSALMMRAALWELNTDREKEGLAPLRVSCGIHAGQVLAGCIGTEKATAYSVAGSAVTQAVIACGECVPLQTDIMITGAAREIAGDRIIAEELQPSRPGNEGLLIFALVNASPSGGQEMHWPFTLDDVRESLRGRRNSV